jgi:hypothetical protein
VRAERFFAPTRRVRAAIIVCAGALLATGDAALAQPVNYDGTYAGSQTLMENSAIGNYPNCLRGPFKRRMIVKDSTVSYTYNPTYQGAVTGTVTPGGEVTGYVATPEGGVRLTGKIAGDAFTGEVRSVICSYSLQLNRTP